MRSTFQCSVHEFGTSRLTWREAIALTLTAIKDGGTYLGAEMRDARFCATDVEVGVLKSLASLLARGDEKAIAKNEKLLLPYDTEKKKQQARSVDADEYADATRAMLAQFGIDPAVAEADIAAASSRL